MNIKKQENRALFNLLAMLVSKLRWGAAETAVRVDQLPTTNAGEPKLFKQRLLTSQRYGTGHPALQLIGPSKLRKGTKRKLGTGSNSARFDGSFSESRINKKKEVGGLSS